MNEINFFQLWLCGLLLSTLFIGLAFILGMERSKQVAKPEWLEDQFRAIKDDSIRSAIIASIRQRELSSPLTVGEFEDYHCRARELAADSKILMMQMDAIPHLPTK